MIKHNKKITLENKIISKENESYLRRFKLSLKTRNRTDGTIYNYARDIISFINYIDKDVTLVTEQDIHTYLNKCKELGNEYKRILRRFRTLSSFYSFLRDKRHIKDDPTLHIKIKEYE